MALRKTPQTLRYWQPQAEKALQKVLKSLENLPPRFWKKTAFRKSAVQALQCHVLMVGTAKMTQLNSRYRGKRKPTDVLSFPASEPFYSQGMLGDLVICVPVLLRQAREMKLSPKAELFILLTHGVLHLMGFDHEAGGEAAREMKRWENEVLSQLTIEKGLVARSD